MSTSSASHPRTAQWRGSSRAGRICRTGRTGRESHLTAKWRSSPRVSHPRTAQWRLIIQGRHDRLGQKGEWPARSRTRRPEWPPRNQGDHYGHRQHRQHSGLTAGSLRLLPGKRQGLQQVEPGPGPCKPKEQFHTQLPLGLTQGTWPTRGGSIGSIGGGGGYLHHPGGEGEYLLEKGGGGHPHLPGGVNQLQCFHQNTF